jgi:4-amino-4-deoxychorismate lyase
VIIALLGVGVVPTETPILRADDLGAVRGDGVFETMHVRGGEPWLLDEHLARMARSAGRLAISLPSAEELTTLAGQACAAWDPAVEGALRLICTRGPDSGGAPTVYATLGPVGEAILRGRRDGIAVRTLPLGVDAEARVGSPWLLAGAKTLSYAVNMASLRAAVEAGADDALWVSADGYALEGPTATLVWLTEGTLCTVPAERTGILAGTTARHLLDRAGELGYRTDERLIRPEELAATEGAWLTSSVRGAVEIRSLDEKPLGPSADTTRIQKLLGFTA